MENEPQPRWTSEDAMPEYKYSTLMKHRNKTKKSFYKGFFVGAVIAFTASAVFFVMGGVK
jgi:hypothetical protein